MNSLIKFPIWKDDGKNVVSLNSLQKHQIENFTRKVKMQEYKFVNNPCLCGNTNVELDIVVAQKDRYGIACENVLCKKCGLIRLKERLDDISTAEFYQNEYRDIYVGEEQASDDFFDSQVQRGRIFYDLIEKFIDLKEIRTVFEIGCGAGGILYPFFESGKKVSGCDFGEKYLKYGQNKGLELYQGEIDESKTPKNSQDLIILSHVMEHFTEPLNAMNDIIKFITPGKYLLVEVPGIFWIPKTYINPILYFQNAHVHNYYYYYLKLFFETLGLRVVYGNERCTFIVQKPKNWKQKNNLVIYDKDLEKWANRVERSLKKYYLQHIFKLNPSYYKIGIIKILDIIGIKETVKKLLKR